jgi:hypothetical protein
VSRAAGRIRMTDLSDGDIIASQLRCGFKGVRK